MAIKPLYDLLSLQVPNIDHVVLGAAHDPLTTSDRKISEYAILLVFMTRISLQTLSLTVVPQFERTL